MTQWEYKIVHMTTEKGLNDLGKEGWEIFHITPHLIDPKIYLRRSKFVFTVGNFVVADSVLKESNEG